MNTKFRWCDVHQKEFDAIKAYFNESTTLAFFDPGLPTWIFVDAAKQGLSAVIAQGETIDATNVVAFASRTTTDVERRYPQIDLEAMAIDFGLRRFREYCVGGDNINFVTDHKPLKPIFVISISPNNFQFVHVYSFCLFIFIGWSPPFTNTNSPS